MTVDASVANSTVGKEGTATPASRLSHTTACLPIVYGSVAFFMGKKADEYHTHKWTLYLRGPNDEDLGVCISKVIFQLHPSFAQPVRELTHAPFEVTESGWGEFEAQLRIIWKDSSEKPIVLNHGIKLYPPEEPVVAENFDEVVFTNPHETFYRQLQRISIVPKVLMADAQVQASFFDYTDHDDFTKLVEAQTFLQKELSSVKERLKLVMSDTDAVDDALIQLQESKRAAAAQRSSSAKANKAAAAAAAVAGSSGGGPASKKQKTG